MTDSYQTLIYDEPDAHIACIRLHRPDAANALNMQMGTELHNCITALPTTCRAVILTGQGKHFCAGADLKERKGMTEAQWHDQHDIFEKALQAIMDCPAPIIAAVNGAAFGAGMELALACDFMYASQNARFALSETTLGIIPGLGGTQNLPRALGMRRAKEQIFKGTAFTAEEAEQWGLSNRTCMADRLFDDSLACARTMAANAPLAIQAAKQSIQTGYHLPISDGLKCELVYYNELLSTCDRHEGINAFNEKRKPRFTGE